MDHILSNLSTMTSPSWVAPWAWLSFVELDKAVVHVIRLVSFLLLWFQSFCPLMPSFSTYCLTGVSLTLYVEYFFTAAPAKRSRCSLPWKWGIFSLPLLLTFDVGCLLSAACHSSTVQRQAALMAQMIKNPPALRETWIQSLSWEDPLEESMVTHSSILAGESP